MQGGRFIASHRRDNRLQWKEIMATQTLPETAQDQDTFPINGTDYIEFYVGNAKQAARYYKTAFGFQSLAYSGPETGTKDRVSYAIRQNKLTFPLTTPLRLNNPIADHIALHGDGVKVLALKVEDATSACTERSQMFHRTICRAARLRCC